MGERVLGGVRALAAAVEGYQGLFRHLALANRALGALVVGVLGGGVLEAYPPVYARPAVEMAAQCDHGVVHEVEADVALEADGGVGFRFVKSRGQGFEILARSFDSVVSCYSSEILLHLDVCIHEAIDQIDNT